MHIPCLSLDHHRTRVRAMCACVRARHSRSYSTERQSLGVSLFTFTTISSSSRCPPDTRGRHERKGEGEGLRAREATLFTNLIQWTLTSIFLSCTCTLAGLTNSAHTQARVTHPAHTGIQVHTLPLSIRKFSSIDSPFLSWITVPYPGGCWEVLTICSSPWTRCGE